MKILCFLLLTLAPLHLRAQELPAPWKHQDIGPAQVAGAAKHHDGVFTLAGTGDLWGNADGGHFLSQTCSGDVEIIARVVSMDNPGKVAHAKAGLCLRESANAGARCVAMCVTASDGAQMTCRDSTDGKTARVKMNAAAATPATVEKGKFPCWLKLVRHGGEFSGYESSDGKTWALTGQIKIDFTPEAQVGLSSSSHTKDTLTTFVFDQVKVFAPDVAR